MQIAQYASPIVSTFTHCEIYLIVLDSPGEDKLSLPQRRPQSVVRTGRLLPGADAIFIVEIPKLFSHNARGKSPT